MKWTLLAFFLFSSLAFAQTAEDCEDDTTKEILPMMDAVAVVAVEQPAAPSCPNPKKLENICMTLPARTMDPKPKGDYVYMYQRKLLDAACVDVEKDSEEKINEKVQQMWTASADILKCESIQFDVTGGNILKYAVSTKFDEFLDDAIYWKVNLNKVDASDQRTVLDYVKYQIEKNKGSNIESKLQHYYKILKDAGAKHKSEL